MSTLKNPRYVDAALRIVLVLLQGLGGVVSFQLLLPYLFAMGPARLLVAAVVMLAAIGVSVAIHEWGHFLAARLQGMRVLSVRLGALLWQARRRGWHWRWHRVAGPAGVVSAIPRPGQLLRRRYLILYAAGPVANLIAAAAMAVAATLTGHSVAALLLQVLVVWNLVIALGNLLPIASPFISDGRHLLYWLGRPDEKAPALALVRLLAGELEGQTACERDSADIDALAQQPQPSPLLGLLLRLKQVQEAGDWSAAETLTQTMQQQRDALPAAMAAAGEHFFQLMHAEMAFARAAASGDAALLPQPLPARTAWFDPTLWPRCLALKAALAGDPDACERHLAEAAAAAYDTLESHASRADAAVAAQVRRIALARVQAVASGAALS